MMSAASMVESYDAQMTDYSGDIDMQLHGADPWFNNESTMAEDGLMDDFPQVDHEGVEVDMEAYGTESVEYEMADDVGEDGALDVEVYDISQIHSPTVIAAQLPDDVHSPHIDPAAHTTLISFLDQPLHEEIQEQREGLPSDGLVQLEGSDDQLRGVVENTPQQATSDPAVAYAEVTTACEGASSPLATLADVSSLIQTSFVEPYLHELSKEQPKELPVDSGTKVMASFENRILNGPDLGQEAPSYTHTHLDTLVTDQARSLIDRTASAGPEPRNQSESDEQSATIEEQREVADDLQNIISREGDSQFRSDPNVTSREVVVEPYYEEQSFHSGEDDDASGAHSRHTEIVGNPLEISEGVYIDPPPAVLLALPPSSSTSECCLFNRPGVASNTNSPVDETSRPPDNHVLLLHHRPTLYYESLSDVFGALRQDEYLASVSELMKGELVLDAYDLQLAISEDNVYAREVTLHDLNVLHDGSGFFGPLRVRLLSIIPRFILRYHDLQDQVARLNLTVESDGTYDEAPKEQHHTESVEDQQSQQTAGVEIHNRENEEQREEANQKIEKGIKEDLDQHEGVQKNEDNLEYGGDTGRATGDISSNPAADNYENYEPQDDGHREDEDYDASVDAGEGEDAEGVGTHEAQATGIDSSATLDADDLHDGAGSEAAENDYTEYEEYVCANDDDDERYGEDLPEELGGMGSVNDGQAPEHAFALQPEASYMADESQDDIGRIADPTIDLPFAKKPQSVLRKAASDSLETIGNSTSGNKDASYSAEDGETASSSANQGVLKETDSDTNSVATLDDENDPADHFDSLSKQARIEDQGLDGQDDRDDWSEDNGEGDPDGEGEYDGEGDYDATWGLEPDSLSTESSNTLSSHISKRGFDEIEHDEIVDSDEVPSPSSLNSKRLRIS